MKGKAFEPLRINQMVLRNRIVRTAHGVRLPWADDGGRQIDYHVARAKGGAAMAIIGICGVHETNPTTIPLHEDRVVLGLRAIADAVHEHDMKLVTQLWHGGAIKPNVLGGAPWSASAVPIETTGLVPQAMTKAMIDEMVESFAKGAKRSQAAGLDGVEVHGANGYLIAQFLSRATNHREDEYGGSLENRMRFLAEILDAVRATVGRDFAVGLRISSYEFVEEGLVPDEAAQIARAMESRIDYLNVSLGGYFRPDMMVAPMDEPLGYQLEYSRPVTAAVSVPTIVAGRIMTMDHANEIVASGAADMVSMVRGLIADPEVVKKSAEDRTAEIRPCIGILDCVGTTLTETFRCAVNPAAGYERDKPPLEDPAQRAATPRSVLVVGGGPGGMEAARTAAIRGHQVTLYELRRQLGGQANIAARAPFRADFNAITAWQAGELRRLGVKVVLRTAADPDVVAALGPDVLVMATGSEPRRDGRQLARPATPLSGADLPHVYTSWDLLGDGGRTPVAGASAVVYDDTGDYEPLSVADELIRLGAHVTFVTKFDGLGQRINARRHTIAPILRRLTAAGIDVVPHSYLEKVTPAHVTVRSGDRTRDLPADSLFFIGVNQPSTELAGYLEDYSGEIHYVGDAAGYHSLGKAIHDGDAVGRMI